ncbi:MAG: AAA family ATPase [bacterium]|nr:AAA family ATPase [bacterium]
MQSNDSNTSEGQSPIEINPRGITPEDSIRAIETLERMLARTIDNLATSVFAPDGAKTFDRTFAVGKAADMVGVTTQSIYRKEQEGELAPQERTSTNRRMPYSLDQVNHLRGIFKTLPHRDPSSEPVVLSWSSFKGGCGKSTLSVHCAQYLALRGYRVLFIDCDPQASASMLFGYTSTSSEQPSGPSLADYLEGDIDDFQQTIQRSHFPGIDIVPADLFLTNTEYQLAHDVRDDPDALLRLSTGVRSAWRDYDVVVLDPPPALGFLSISVLAAANALLIPMRPSLIDFASTHKFLQMLHSNMSSLASASYDFHHHFASIVINGYDEQKGAHVEIAHTCEEMFTPSQLVPHFMRDSAEIENAGKELKSVFDLQGPVTSYETHRRCISYMNRLFREVERRIQNTWQARSTRY